MAQLDAYTPITHVLTYSESDDADGIRKLLKIVANLIDEDEETGLISVARDEETNELLVTSGNPATTVTLPPAATILADNLSVINPYDQWLQWRKLGAF